MTSIEWTGKTWNPIVGCTVTSTGCKNCYAMKMAGRIQKMQPGNHYTGTTEVVNGKTVWTGQINSAPDETWDAPLKRKKPTTYFVNSMGDLFHPNVADYLIDRVFAVMALSPQHKFQILTKHPERMRDYLNRYETDEWADLHAMRMLWNALQDAELSDRRRKELMWLLDEEENFDTGLCFQPDLWPHVALGVSVENQAQAEARIPYLLQTRAAIRFISAEPLLGRLDLTKIDITKHCLSPEDIVDGFPRMDLNALSGQCSLLDKSLCSQLDWVIVGGESGGGARPMHPDWARSLRDDCEHYGVPFFFKQWGLNIPHNQCAWPVHSDYPDDDVFRGQKNLDPKTLDGVVHHAMPRGFEAAS